MFDPNKASENIKNEFVDYITTSFPLNIKELSLQFKSKIQELISKGPYVDIKPVFKSSYSLRELVNKGIISKLFLDLEKNKPADSKHKIEFPLDRPLYNHQVSAIEKVGEGKNIVVTTGTGSGKTESFLIPIINDLLKEKEETGSISDEVKVLLIYPMNALANDQMKRLRNAFMYYPDITFSVYTGETEENDRFAISKYINLHENEKSPELKKPLPNEYISRSQIKKHKPHILITNYAMLERILLQPETAQLFAKDCNENKGKFYGLRYIVLDEAHVYHGARGMETALLLRRIKGRFYTKNLKVILTSATLGKENEAEGDIAQFANNLTGEYFDKESIIFSSRAQINYVDKPIALPMEFYKKVSEYSNNNRPLSKLFDKFGLDYDLNLPDKENLYNLLYKTGYYQALMHSYWKYNTVVFDLKNIAAIIGASSTLEAIYFINACGYCQKDGAALLDARYHFFLRALEGCYLSFSDIPQLELNRIKEDNLGFKMFEIAVCRKCGDLAIYGVIKNGHLEYKPHTLGPQDGEPMYFHFSSSDVQKEIEDIDEGVVSEEDAKSDDNYIDKKGTHKVKEYYLCPKCGRINPSEDGEPHCDCHVGCIKVYSVGKDYQGCLKCVGGKYNTFYLGYDAATSVIATSLFEQLPTKQIMKNIGNMDMYFEGGKQFLSFSDSRSEAAFFSSYLNRIYEVFLRRRTLAATIDDLEPYLISKPMNLDEFFEYLKNSFAEKKIFKKDNEDNDEVEIIANAKRNAWYSILTELCSQNSMNSLSSMGLIKFEYGGLDELLEYFLNYDKFSKYMNKELAPYVFNELMMSFAYWGAIKPNYPLDENDLQFIFYCKSRKYITLKKEYIENDENAFRSRYIASWLPRIRKGTDNKFIKNRRYILAKKLFNCENDTLIIDFLNELYDFISYDISSKYRLCYESGNLSYMPTKAFIIKSPKDPSLHWYICDKCSRITSYNLEGKCPNTGCGGTLSEINPEEHLKDNHFYQLYKKDLYKKLFINEHTAQLSSEDAEKYQSNFESNKINALSCSTTFEMGVDVGSLETVFLRNLPPSPSNYTQRSGRAGRSNDSCAYTITYAKLSSHDFTYFAEPKKMICGEINPPKFKINNTKILLRHIFGVVMAYALIQEENGYCHFDKKTNHIDKQWLNYIKDILAKKPAELTLLLKKSFKDVHNDEIIPESYNWVDYLVGEEPGCEGALTLCVNDYDRTMSSLQKVMNDYDIKAKNEVDCNTRDKYYALLKYYNNQMKQFMARNFINVYSKFNVLPRYGFPIDIATLDVNNIAIDLSRDLSLAINEYAPGERVIANDKSYLSRYLVKVPHYKKDGSNDDKFIYHYFHKCTCGTYNYTNIVNENISYKCSGCGCEIPVDKWEKAIIPYGFKIDKDQTEVVQTISKPQKIYSSEACYVGDGEAIKSTSLLLNGNEINLKHTQDDEIMIVSNNPFYICPECGYTYGKYDKIKDPEGKVDKNLERLRLAGTNDLTVSRTHFKDNGYPCKNHKFVKTHLMHVYKTDVVTMDFKFFFNDKKLYEESLSALYAILDALALVLDIEREEISGTIKNNNGYISMVLFDTVPGGAGNVKRLLDNNCELFQVVIKNAIGKMKACNCGSSCYNCLRSYANQRYHDVLDRFKAIDFLEQFVGKTDVVSSNKKPTKKFQTLINPTTPVYDNVFSVALSDLYYELDEFAEEYNELNSKFIFKQICNPDYVDFEVDVNGKKLIIPMYWKNKKIVLLDSIESYENLKSYSDCKFHIIGSLNIDEFLKDIEE